MNNEMTVKAYWFDQLSDLAIARSIIAKQQQDIADRDKEIAELKTKSKSFSLDEPDPQP